MIIINYIIIIIINLVIFLNGSYEIKSFNDKKEAEELLTKSRKSIYEIDNQIFDLISQRTAFARDIASCKEYLEMPIFDESREKVVHTKVRGLAEEKGLDVDIINQIVDMLTILNKNAQNEIIRRNVDGKY